MARRVNNFRIARKISSPGGGWKSVDIRIIIRTHNQTFGWRPEGRDTFLRLSTSLGLSAVLLLAITELVKMIISPRYCLDSVHHRKQIVSHLSSRTPPSNNPSAATIELSQPTSCKRFV